MKYADKYEILKNSLEGIQGLHEANYILKHTNPASLAPNGVVPNAQARQEEYVRQIAGREEPPPPDNPPPKQEPPPQDPKTKKQERKQTAVKQLAHNIQEPAFSILPPEQQEHHRRGRRSANDEYEASIAKNKDQIEMQKYKMLHPETRVTINQPMDNGVNEQVAAAELQQAQAEDEIMELNDEEILGDWLEGASGGDPNDATCGDNV